MAALPFDASSTSCPASGEAADQPAAQRVVIVSDENAAHSYASRLLDRLALEPDRAARHRQRRRGTACRRRARC